MAVAGRILIWPAAWIGFAGALTEIGLPQGDIPLALFAFNVGVEAGQLIFTAVVLGALRLAKSIKFRFSSNATQGRLRPMRSGSWPRTGLSSD